MFSIAVVIFREIFEIALIVGILMAATRGLAKRGKWVLVGVLGGVAGSVLIAFFADRISQAAEGMGQEMLNASILLIAAALIGWTVLWMTRHGRELTQHLKQVGHSVVKGEKPIYTLAVVVTLTVLREGAEIVMFTYSAFITGGRPLELTLGFLFGGFAGAAVGVILYYGLIKIPTKQIFTVTSWLLIFLVAGMVSQAAGYLTAAGVLPELVPSMWDTSSLLAENSLVGKFLQVLVGYTQRPSGIQVLMYAVTLAGLSIAIKLYGYVPSKTAQTSV
ncbi:MAG: FTR1 family protein [Candidatus Omnitrophica bacterium]|nr:FTR1 family protein [Candidatus Omnitrophota bacterium]